MVVLFNDSDILVKSEDRASEQKRLRHVVEKPTGHVIDLDHLIGNERDAARDEQHRTDILIDFKTFLFHGILLFTLQSYEKFPILPNKLCFSFVRFRKIRIFASK